MPPAFWKHKCLKYLLETTYSSHRPPLKSRAHAESKPSGLPHATTGSSPTAWVRAATEVRPGPPKS